MTTKLAADTIWDPIIQQGVYRRLLEATSYPGNVLGIDESPAWLAALAALLDAHCTLADPDSLLSGEQRAFLAARIAPLPEAEFVLVDAARDADNQFTPRRGELISPEFGATIILVGGQLAQGRDQLVLRGPGIKDRTTLKLEGFRASWFEAREHLNAEFPLGVDFILCTQTDLVCLPRTTIIEERTWDM